MAEPLGVKSASGANISLAATILLFAYVGIAVLKQSDAELILPASRFDLGGLLEHFKEGIPGGHFVAPLLQIEIPLTVFYMLGPLGLLLLHAVIVFQQSLLRDAAVPLRVLVIWLPPLVLGLIRWRFVPYVASRPEPAPVAARALELLQVSALAADIGVTALAILCVRGSAPEGPFARIRWVTLILQAWWQAGILWLGVLVLARPSITVITAGAPALSWDEMLLTAMGAWLVVTWIAGRRPTHWKIGLSRRFIRRPSKTEDLDMRDRLLLAVVFLGLVLLPVSGRAIDLSGESLVAQAPSETLMAALVVAEGANHNDAGTRLLRVRRDAWSEYGRGVDLSHWRFPAGRFDHATMARINLTKADLRSASLDYANLIGANLVGASFVGASLRYADLSNADKNSGITTVSETSGAPDQPLDLSHANLTGAQLVGADLTGANLTQATLRGAILERAILKGANLTGADFCGADLRFVDLSNAVMTHDKDITDFRGADLSGTTLPRDFQNARLDGANLYGAHIQDGTQPVMPTWQNLHGNHIRQIKSLSSPQGEVDQSLCESATK